MGGPIATAQKQLNVGIGALAGSTIMLLTVPWFLSIYAGRVLLNSNGEGNYMAKKGNKLPKVGIEHPLTQTGINCSSNLKQTGIIMLLTAGGYILIQGSAFGANCWLKSDKEDCEHK